MNQSTDHRPGSDPAPTRAYDTDQWSETQSWDALQRADANSARSQGEATRQFSWEGDSAGNSASQSSVAYPGHSGQHYGSGNNGGESRRTQSTDDLDEVRVSHHQVGRNEPTMVMPQSQPAAYDSHPVPSSGTHGQQHHYDARPYGHDANAGRSSLADVSQRLRDLPSGPSAGARVGSLIVALLFGAVLVFMVWDAQRGGDSLVMSAILQNLGGNAELNQLAIAGLYTIPLIGIALSMMLSGLGVGVLGIIAVIAGVVLLYTADNMFNAWGMLVPVGVFLMLAGVAAHTARAAGYGRARRIVTDM